MHNCHRRHHHWGSSWGPSLGGAPAASAGATLVSVDQQATAIAYGGGTAVAINITYVFVYM